jgi:tight adherence protein B
MILQIVTALAAILCLIGGIFAVMLFQREREAKPTRERLTTLALSGAVSAEPAVARETVDINALLPLWLRRRLFQAGFRPDASRMGLVVIGLAGLWVVLTLSFGLFVASIAWSAVLGSAIGIVDYAASRRMEALSGTMSSFLDRVRQLLVVGNALSVALARATQSSPPILVEFFSPTIRRIANGAGVAESVNALADDLDLAELRLFGTAIETNLRFGGSLTAVLANLIENMRRRAAVDRELRANTSQIRASAWVLGLLPLLASAVVMLSNPDYARYFIDEPMGNKFLIYAGLSELVGAFLMRAVVRVSY